MSAVGGTGTRSNGSPGAGSPGAGSPGAGSPGAGSPGAGSPGAGSPGGSLAAFNEKIANGQGILTRLTDTYTNKYLTQNSNGVSLGIQSNKLSDEVLTLKAKLAKAKSISDTYDREYLDRMHHKSWSFWRSRGVSTLQDWVLLIFFLIYTILALAIIGICIMYSNIPIFATIITTATAIALGTLIVGIIVRFA